MERQSIVIAAPRRAEVIAEPLPRGVEGQVLVRTLISAISPGTELLFYRGDVPPDMAVDSSLDSTLGALAAVQYPLRYGYACVGRVVDIAGDADRTWLDRLVFAFVPHTSHFWADPHALIPLPAGIDPLRGALLPNMETAVNFVMDGQPMIGERVAVVGQGIVGLLTLGLLRQFPLARLAAVDPIPLRQAAAARLGADEALWLADNRPPAGWEGADLAYELSGNPAALNTAIALTGFGGRIVIGSWYGRKQAPIDLGGAFHRSRIRLIGSQVSTIDPQWSGRWDKARRFAWAWRMLAHLDLDPLITHRFPIADASAAYELLDERPQEAIQVVFTYPEPAAFS
jgi:2-desacetyl-2-hydroxyethyl bacteriochlorophyllide A dehydrogenase